MSLRFIRTIASWSSLPQRTVPKLISSNRHFLGLVCPGLNSLARPVTSSPRPALSHQSRTGQNSGQTGPHSGEFGDRLVPHKPQGLPGSWMCAQRHGYVQSCGIAWGGRHRGARNENRSSHTYTRCRRWRATRDVMIGVSRATRLSSDKITEEALKLISNASKITVIVHISTRKIKISHIFSGEVGR